MSSSARRARGSTRPPRHAAPRGLRIGITIGLREAGESLWINGIKQNALYLARMFMHSPRKHQVTLVNTTDIPVTGALPWDREAFPTLAFAEIKDRLDVLIELGGQISTEQTAYLKSSGTRIVSYCCGPEYVQTMEAMLFNRGDGAIFINECYDEIWVIPQIRETSWHFFGTLRRCPVRSVPFVWDPMCLEACSQALPEGGVYRPQRGPRRLTVMEPNHDVFKFCVYPMLIADTTFRQVGEQIGHLHVTNAEHLGQRSPMFASIAHALDLVRANRASFVGRYETPYFLSAHTDIVISHQWGLALNYFYFDVCWQGYALVHNAQLCRNLGYFYPGNDVEQGARQLARAVREHDTDWQGYRARQRELIGAYLATNPEVCGAYDTLLDQLTLREAVL